MIQAARGRALAAVNTELIDLYWRVGEYISRKLETAAWGEGVVEALAATSSGTTRTSGLHPAQPLSDAAVLRDLPRGRESLTTGETIAVDPSTCSS